VSVETWLESLLVMSRNLRHQPCVVGCAHTGIRVARHVVVFNAQHLIRLVREYISYYHQDRTHLGLDKDTPADLSRTGRHRQPRSLPFRASAESIIDTTGAKRPEQLCEPGRRQSGDGEVCLMATGCIFGRWFSRRS